MAEVMLNIMKDDPCTVYSLHDTSSVLLTPDSTPTKTSDCSSSGEDDGCTRLSHVKQVTGGALSHSIMLNSDGSQQGDNSPSESDDQEESSQSMDSSRGLIRSQSDTVLDSPKPSKAKLVKSDRAARQEETTVIVSKPPKPGTMKSATGSAAASKGGRRQKRATKDTTKKASASKTTSASSKDKRRSSSVPAKGKKEQSNKLMTDFFPVRRSGRVPKSKLQEQTQKEIERAILSNCEDGLKVVNLVGKGRGIVASKSFLRGDFVIEYHGDLIGDDAAKTREKRYGATPEVGCYMYYFRFNNKCYCVDATAESGRLGRLINHSKNDANLSTKVIGIKGRPHLILVAARDITIGEELLYDYGDRNKEALEAHPWLKL